jgi:hypothetical protein
MRGLKQVVDCIYGELLVLFGGWQAACRLDCY